MADVAPSAPPSSLATRPTPRTYVRRSISSSPYRYVARVRYSGARVTLWHSTSHRRRPPSMPRGPTPAWSPPAADDPERLVGVSRAGRGATSRCSTRRRWCGGGSMAARLAAARPGEGRDPEAIGKEQERRREVVVGGRRAHPVPVHLLAHRAHRRAAGRRSRSGARRATAASGDHHASAAAPACAMASTSTLVGRPQIVVGRPATPLSAVQHVDDDVRPSAGLEQPVLGRALDLEAGLGQRRGRRVGVVLGDDEVDVVHRFGRAVHPQRVAARQGELRTRAPSAPTRRA